MAVASAVLISVASLALEIVAFAGESDVGVADVGLDAYPSPTPTTRYTSFASRGRFLAREVYFYGRYLVRRAFGNAP